MPPLTNSKDRAKQLFLGLALRPVIVLVLGFLYAPVALFLFVHEKTGEDDAEAEGREYRTLPAFPASLRALATFPERFQGFFDDQFPLRLPLVELTATLRFRVFDVSPNPAVLIGQDGWFYEGVGKERVQGNVVSTRNHLADHLGELRYTDAELAQWARVLEERRVVLAERGTRYVFALAPSKRMIYPEHLPELLKHMKGETRLEQLSRYLVAHSRVPFVDLTGPLLAEKSVDRPLLFYKTDGHWNYYGAFVAYRALVDETNHAFPGLLGPALELDDFELRYDRRWSHPRFTAMMGVRVVEPYLRLVAREDNPLSKLRFKKGRSFRQLPRDAAGEDSVSLGREGIGGIVQWPERSYQGTRYRYVKGATRRPLKIFVLGDSFIEKTYYFFAAHADEVYGYREILGFPDALVKKLAPDLVVHAIVQSFILGEIPKNPDSISQAYLRIKHDEAKGSLLEAVASSLSAETEGQASLGIPPFGAPGGMPLVLSVSGTGSARFWFESASGRRRRQREPEGSLTRYLELDAAEARTGGRLVFDAPKEALADLRVSVRRLEE